MRFCRLKLLDFILFQANSWIFMTKTGISINFSHIYEQVYKPLGCYLVSFLGFPSWTGSTETGCGRLVVVQPPVIQSSSHLVYRSQSRCPITMLMVVLWLSTVPVVAWSLPKLSYKWAIINELDPFEVNLLLVVEIMVSCRVFGLEIVHLRWYSVSAAISLSQMM